MRSVGRRLATAGAAAALAAGVVLATAPAADAHADIAWTAPAAGERVERAPGELVLHLTEPVVADRTRVTVVDAAGTTVDVGDLRITEDDALDVRSSVSLHVPLPALAASSYHVTWRTVSRDDMHSTYGSFVFGVGTDVDGTAAGPASTSSGGARRAAETTLRWLGFLGLALLLGGTAVDRLGAGAPRLRRLAATGGVLATAAAAGSGALLLATDAGAVTGSRYGPVWGGYVVLLGAATLAARAAGRTGLDGRDVVRRQVAALALAAAAAGVSALVGHAAAASTTPLRTAAVTAAHLLGTALWSGLLVALAVARPPRTVLRRVAVVAAPAVVVSVVTGLQLAGLLVPSTGALGGSGYGRLVVVKAGLVAVAGLLGAVNAWSVRRTRAVRTVRVEALALLGVLAAAAVLGSLAPPTSPRWAPTPAWTADVEPRTVSGDDLLVSVSLAPNRPGSSFVTAQVVSTRRPDPGPVTGVDIAVGGSTAVAAVAQGHGGWVSPAVDVARSGPARVAVVVHRTDLPDTRVEVPWTVAPRPGTQAAGTATAPLLAWAGWAVALLGAAAGAVAGLVGSGARRRRPAGIPADDLDGTVDGPVDRPVDEPAIVTTRPSAMSKV